ncbi:MAG: AtpZ/AtpI family protein [Alphaproteobacteria bacterium]
MANKGAFDGASRRQGQTGKQSDLLPEGQFERRLEKLEAALDDVRPEPQRTSGPVQTRGADYSNALRMSSEFVAAILVGTILGWGLDKVAGTKPWGMIILMMLGFAAGVMNVLRTAGTTPQSGGEPGATTALDEDDD